MTARRTLILVLGLAALALTAGAGAARPHGGSGLVSVRGTVGSLRLDHSTAADVRRFAGPPDYSGIGSFRPGASLVPRFLALGYDCRRVKQDGIPLDRLDPKGYPASSGVDCKTTYYVNERTHTLGYFASSVPAFETPLGTHVGTAWSHVKEHGVYYVNCGGPFVNGAEATLSIWNVGGKRPGNGSDASKPIVGGRVAGLDLESTVHPLTFFCW